MTEYKDMNKHKVQFSSMETKATNYNVMRLISANHVR